MLHEDQISERLAPFGSGTGVNAQRFPLQNQSAKDEKMIRSSLPPGPLEPPNRVIVVPARKLSTSQRNFIRASIAHARQTRDEYLDNQVKRWDIEPEHFDDDVTGGNARSAAARASHSS